jgi:type I restriction enzyme S subunit
MGREWREITLGEVLTLQRGYDLPARDRRAGAVPIVTSAGISGTHSESRAKAPGVATGRYGTVGQVYYLTQDFWPHNTALYVKDFKGNDPRFASYLLKTIDFLSCSDKSGVPGVNRNDLHLIKVKIPDLNEQRAISQILGALDDKILLNIQINKTLEALAQSFFKSQFLDIVRSGRFPKGWGESTIGEEVRVVGGNTPSTAKPEFWEGGTHHWATPKDLSDLDSPILLETERKITDAGIQQIGSGLLPVGTILLSSRAPIGYLATAEVPVAVNQGFIAMVCDGSLPNHYVRHWTRANKDAIEGRANGTTFMEISKGNFRPLPVVVPPKEMLDDFQKQVEPLHRRVVSNLRECRTLSALRDALLPKLLSGELRVPQAIQIATNVISLPVQQIAKPERKVSDEFVEAIVIAQFVRALCDSKFPLLGRKRYNKFAYIAHRKAEDDVTVHYLKKAAGPYSPWAKYQGPEKIALQNGYIKNTRVGEMIGFGAGDKICEIDRYLHYPICEAVKWVVSKFRYKRTDDLELLATVDYAALDLLRENEPVSWENIKQIIATNKEWAPKLKREIFSDANIIRALNELRGIFPGTYGEAL